jgi:hypothetical protein
MSWPAAIAFIFLVSHGILGAAVAEDTKLQTSYRIRVMPDPETGLPKVDQQNSAAMAAERRNSRILSVVVKQLQPRPDPWRVQARSEPLNLDGRKAYNWELFARSGNRKTSVNVALYSYTLKKVVAVEPAQVTDSWKRLSLRLVQPAVPGTYEFQVHVGASLGSFYFRDLSLTSQDLDLSFLYSVDERIRSVRQGNFWISAVDGSGSPLPAQGFNITLQRHAFHWGTAIEPEVVQRKNPRYDLQVKSLKHLVAKTYDECPAYAYKADRRKCWDLMLWCSSAQPQCVWWLNCSMLIKMSPESKATTASACAELSIQKPQKIWFRMQ